MTLSEIATDFTENWLLYCSIPLVAALIGWITKIAAVQMLLRPLEFVGIPPYLGWQGVVPRATPRMARIAVDLMFGRLINPQEIIDRIDIANLTERLSEPLNNAIHQMVHQVMEKQQPGLWSALPTAAQNALIRRVQGEVPGVITEIVADLRENLDLVVDLRAMAIDALVNDKSLMVKLVDRVGKNELRFIIRSGLLFGFLLGLVQAVVWAFTHSEWLMPIFGGLTGLSTDWLALQMIFRPINRKRYFGVIPWQGLFHKRRVQVTADYGELVATEILTPANILEAVLEGPRSDRLMSLLTRHMTDFVDAQTGVARPVITLVAGTSYEALKKEAVDQTIAYIRKGPENLEGFAIDTFDLRSIVIEKVDQLTDEEYEGLLRPAFKQDEWKLVAMGAVLGFLVGELQVHLLLG
ncbi:DUF445 domain-containing protein [Aldersonia kunmingensis]|uniref:DUF445 domain-containing protein n=1 Tax=Aldersonia kunmingensis TaxID=408066 RepID=UPI00082E0D30|nr:DUF445 family protein [Aldersonia kunmingensis]